MSSGCNDLYRGLRRWRLWSAFAWEELTATYRRSIFGVLWVSLSFGIFIAVKILIFGPLVGRFDTTYYAAYLAIGFFAWQFMVQIVSGAPNTFLSAENWIRNDPLPLSVFAYRGVLRSLFDLVLTGLVLLAVLVYLGTPVGWMSLLAFPALLLFLLNAIWIKLLLGVICTRFRDIGHLVQTTMRVMFFLTPILWLPEQMPERLMQYLWWNPFAHFIWILRTPVLENLPATDSWIFALTVTGLGWIVTLVVFGLFRRRVVFWF